MRAQRRTQKEVRAQKRSSNEVWLKNALPKSDDETSICQCWKQCIMINMHVYLPEKYRSPFLHGVFLFSKVGVLAVDFDGFFALAYSSHLLWSWPLGRTWYRHTSLSSIPLSQGLPILPDSFLRKVIMEPALPEVFYCPPAWSYPQVFNLSLGMRLCEGRFDNELLSCRFVLEFQSYSRHKNHFDIDSKQTHSEEIQVIHMERFSEVMNLLSWFWWKYEVTFGWSKWFKI